MRSPLVGDGPQDVPAMGFSRCLCVGDAFYLFGIFESVIGARVPATGHACSWSALRRYVGRGKAGLAVVGCVVFVIASLAIFTVGSVESFVIGVVGLVTFGCFGLAWVALGLRRDAGLRIDDDGFDDASSAVSVGRVTWRDVTAIGEWSAFGTRCVVVMVRNPLTYVSRVSWIGRPAARFNTRFVGSPVMLTSTTLRTNHTDLLEAIRAAHRRFLMSDGSQ